MQLHSVAMLSVRDDEPNIPALASPPLPLQGWMTGAASVNDNQAADVYWNAVVQAFPEAEEPPTLDLTPTPTNRRFMLENAAFGLVGAASLFVALACILAR